MSQITAYYSDYLSAQALLGDIQRRSQRHVLRKCIYKKVTFEYDPEVHQAYYRQLDDEVFNGSLQVEAVAWAVGEARGALEELYHRS